MTQLWIYSQDVETQDHAAACPTLPSSQKQWKFTIPAHKLQGMLIFLSQVQTINQEHSYKTVTSYQSDCTMPPMQCIVFLNCFALKDYRDHPIDSAAVSIFAVILAELTNTDLSIVNWLNWQILICQFNQYIYKYWDGSAVYQPSSLYADASLSVFSERFLTECSCLERKAVALAQRPPQ